MSQPDFLYELFEDFMDDPANQDFSMDNGLVCRWLTGQAKISPKISAYYSKPSNQKKLAETIHQNLLPLMSDCNMAMQDIYTLFIQDDTISDAKKKNLASLYKAAKPPITIISIRCFLYTLYLLNSRISCVIYAFFLPPVFLPVYLPNGWNCPH